MDQKVTPNNLSFISECIVNLNKNNSTFTVKDIWDSEYFLKNTVAIYNKPYPKNESAKHEYDKFIQQPLKTLSAAGVLKCKKDGNKNIFNIENKELLFYISIKERNAFVFMYQYLLKVIEDSGIKTYFEKFKNKQDKTSFEELKNKFIRLIIGNTSINTPVEVRRIFPKILNIYAAQNCIKGTKKGRISQNIFYFSDLTYNATNFRDKNKDKTITRKESQKIEKNKEHKKAYSDYLVNKAKNLISKKYTFSELRDKFADGPAVHVHHIFSKSSYPEIAHMLENLIKLTATQHLYHAHPKGNTQIIDKDYQCVLLMAKSKSIEESLNRGEFFYSKNDFLHVLKTGLKQQFDSNSNFEDIRLKINDIFNEA
jgi:hypothetical protein